LNRFIFKGDFYPQSGAVTCTILVWFLAIDQKQFFVADKKIHHTYSTEKVG